MALYHSRKYFTSSDFELMDNLDYESDGIYVVGENTFKYKKSWFGGGDNKWRFESVNGNINNRKSYDNIPLNENKSNTHAHHIDDNHIIYIPKEIHIKCYAGSDKELHRRKVLKALKEEGYDKLYEICMEHLNKN